MTEVKREVYELLRAIGCTLEEHNGIVYVTTTEGEIWDFTIPMPSKRAFLKLGDRVRAKRRVFDLPGKDNPGPIHAEPGEEGVVVHTEFGSWPTVRFDKTNTATCVTDSEVEKING